MLTIVPWRLELRTLQWKRGCLYFTEGGGVPMLPCEIGLLVLLCKRYATYIAHKSKTRSYFIFLCRRVLGLVAYRSFTSPLFCYVNVFVCFGLNN